MWKQTAPYNNQLKTIIMNEEFYNVLNVYIEEYTQEYVMRIKDIARELLPLDGGGIDLEELEDYLQMQQHMFMEKLEQAVEEVKGEIDSDVKGDEKLKTKVLSRIKNSFREIFEKVVSKLKDILN
tara:strand:- start:192 stop:566 length:375 start_codon:yes stop_codon:yes gene_type:complete